MAVALGWQVESDAYVSMDELLAVMWKNGYSDAVQPANLTLSLQVTHLPLLISSKPALTLLP